MVRSDHRHLRTGMNRHFGKPAAYGLKHAHILHDHRIKPLNVERIQIIIQLRFKLLVLLQRIDRQVKLFSMNMGIIDRRQQSVFIGIVGISTGAELLPPI